MPYGIRRPHQSNSAHLPATDWPPRAACDCRSDGPIRLLGIEKDDAGFEKLLVGIAPYIEIAKWRPRAGKARALEPAVLVGGVVDHQLGDDTQLAAMRLAHKGFEVAHAAIGGMDVLVIGDVVAVVAQGRGIERQQPQRGDPEILQVVELARQPLEIADPVIVGVEERLDVQLIDDRVLVPERIALGIVALGARHLGGAWQHGRSIVGRAHDWTAGSKRNKYAGLVCGLSTRCWRLPRHAVTRPVNASSTKNSCASATPHSASGNTISPPCAPCGSRLTTAMTIFPQSAVAFA